MGASLSGRTLDGQWELEARVASGSYATVYRALDVVEGGHVAVKVLTEVSSPEADARFRAEFELLRRFAHPHIVRGHAVGTVDGHPYMVLDYVAGGNVLSLLDEAGPLDAGTAARIGVQVLAALAHAHAKGVVHRDVKPGNVLVDAAGDARLCDFGIARSGDGRARLTQAGSSLGTLLYMAPEQRVDAHMVDLTSDIFSVGCLLYRLVTDESPADLFTLAPDAERWAAVPEPLRPVLLRATHALPWERYSDDRAMAAALLALVPPDRREALMRACDPQRFPEPDPSVRVGALVEEPTASIERSAVPSPAASPPSDPAGRPAVGARGSPPSPWPWRIAVAVFVVILIGIGTMLVG